MFATYGGLRRRVAVLMVLSLVASVLVTAAPAVAADDPEPSYEAKFDACAGVEGSDFTDVPAGHANAGDIDCIAYYGITKGTSATTYSPLMSVTREHMALFLTRLAGRVSIDVVADPADPGFTDTGDLSANSQTAIAQLADLGITQGTSDTTYSPASAVTRGQMALFMARLMDLMDPMDVAGTSYGYTPEDVVEVKAGDSVAAVEVGSPFTDLGSATKSAYDAITELYELGVASGISDTAYAPSASITRAAMAEFMAVVLDHSNARPAGISIQAVTSSKFGTIDTDIVVSYRDDSFASVVDVELLYFHTGKEDENDKAKATLTEDNTCSGTDGACTGQAKDFTDESGNFAIDGEVVEGENNTYYAWMTDEDNDTFDADEVAHASVTLASDNDASHYTVESDIGENADDNTVDMDVTGSVTFTIQLRDAKEEGDDVAKVGVEINVDFRRYTDTDTDTDKGENPALGENVDTLTGISSATLTTDDNGQATYTVSAPDTDSTKDEASVLDQITFTSDLEYPKKASLIVWRDEDPGTPNKAVITVDAPDYAIKYLSDGKMVVDVSATVTLYDMYGNTAGRTYLVDATVGNDGAKGLDDVHVNRKGQARLDRTEIPVKANMVTVAVAEITTKDNTTKAGISIKDIKKVDIHLVSKATGPTTTDKVTVADVYADEDTFRGSNNILYSYDSDDTYIDEKSNIIDMDTFEKEAKGQGIDVLVYDEDGSSIFRLKV